MNEPFILTSLNDHRKNTHDANICYLMKTRLPVSRNYVDTSPFGNEIATDVLVSMINGQMKSSQSVPVSCVNFQSFYIEQSFDDLSITVLGSKVKRRITSICRFIVWIGSFFQQIVKGIQ